MLLVKSVPLKNLYLFSRYHQGVTNHLLNNLRSITLLRNVKPVNYHTMAPVSSISGVAKDLESMNLKATQGQELTPFRRQSAAKDKLNDLVKQNRNFSIIYGGFRANHNIHALCSLYDLGAPASYLQRYFDNSKTYLEPATKELYTITEENWEEHIGKKDAYSSFLKYFDGAVEKLSMLGALKQYVPRLIPGFTGAALHPMIHLGYSVEFDLPLVAAEGLAYAASYYSPIGEAISKLRPEAAATQTPPSSLDLISGYSFDTANIEGGDHRGNNLDTKIHHVVNQFATDIVGLGNRWACTEGNFEERAKDLTLATVKIFGGSYRANTLDFFLLHGLTGNHAVNTLLPILDVADRVRLLNLNFLALTILYLVQGAPSLPEAQLTATTYDGSDMPWQEIIARASEKNDSHVIKGVRCLHQLEVLHGAKGGIFHRPAAHSVLDVLKNDWCFRGIGLLPSN